MTLPEAAASLGVTAATLRQQIANGKLRAKKVGRDWTVTPREVERYRRESLRSSGAIVRVVEVTYANGVVTNRSRLERR